MLTREQIMTMVPGPEMDKLVAENVMGYKREFDEEWKLDVWIKGFIRTTSFQPSGEISDAWEVVEKLRLTHVYEMADFGRNAHPDKPHYAWFHPVSRGRIANDYQPRAKTLTEAICRAALLSTLEV